MLANQGERPVLVFLFSGSLRQRTHSLSDTAIQSWLDLRDYRVKSGLFFEDRRPEGEVTLEKGRSLKPEREEADGGDDGQFPDPMKSVGSRLCLPVEVRVLAPVLIAMR